MPDTRFPIEVARTRRGTVIHALVMNRLRKGEKGKALTASEYYSALPRGEARRLRKACRAVGAFPHASTPRAA